MSRKETYIGFEAPGLKPEVLRLMEDTGVSMAKLLRLAIILFSETYAKEGDALLRRLRQKKVGQHSSPAPEIIAATKREAGGHGGETDKGHSPDRKAGRSKRGRNS